MLEIRAFGGLDVRGSPEPFPPITARPKAAAVLAYLVLAQPGVTQRLDVLAALLWPDLDADRGHAELDRSLAFLRDELPEGVIEAHGGRLVGVVPKRVRCDVYAFEDAVAAGRWEEALELYRGELLEGFEVPGAEAFRRWLEAERDWMRGLAERAREGAAAESTTQARGSEDQDEIGPAPPPG